MTFVAVVLGLLIGAAMTATFTYAGMTLGFSTSGSTVAAILGWGALRGALRRGTIVENNIVQTIASSLNTTAGGVVFTVPVLFLLPGVEFHFWEVAAACVSGALLGVGFVIPIRKQMIEIERLPFPSGTAVATILRSPSQGIAKTRLMLAGACVSSVFFLLKNLKHLPGVDYTFPGSIDFASLLNLPPYVEATASLSLFAIGIGFIAGRNGLFVLAGSAVSYWLIAPLVVEYEWGPAFGGDIHPETIGADIHSLITRPLGIGMLLGGALGGIVLTLPAVRAAFKGVLNASQHTTKSDVPRARSDELSAGWLYGSAGLAVVTLFIITVYGISSTTTPIEAIIRGVVVATLGALWVWFSSIIIAQATGMTDWTPLSGMALLSVVVLMKLSGGAISAAILLGAAVSVACSLSADMMQDLRTGQLVGSRPSSQQWVQLCFCGLGPIIALAVVSLLWQSGPEGQNGFGPGTEIAAPQADALRAVIEQVQQGSIDWTRYGTGALVGACLSFSGIPGLGVIVGISMYLGIGIVLPYGFGAITREVASYSKGVTWCESTGVPVAVGLIVGDGLCTLLFAILTVLGVLQ